jgi:hypothetical protein
MSWDGDRRQMSNRNYLVSRMISCIYKRSGSFAKANTINRPAEATVGGGTSSFRLRRLLPMTPNRLPPLPPPSRLPSLPLSRQLVASRSGMQ